MLIYATVVMLASITEEPDNQSTQRITNSSADTAYNNGDIEDTNGDIEDNNGQQKNCFDAKLKRRNTDGDSEVGAVQVNEQAPHVNRRFYLGLNRPSVIARNRRARRERAARRRRAASGGEDGNSATAAGISTSASAGGASHQASTPTRRSSVMNRMSAAFSRVASQILIEATLVEEDAPVVGEVVEARPMGFFERKWKVFALIMGCALVLMTVLLTTLIARDDDVIREYDVVSTVPSSMPSIMPSFDTRPTLEIVQERGYLTCGLRQKTMEYGRELRLALVRGQSGIMKMCLSFVYQLCLKPQTNLL